MSIPLKYSLRSLWVRRIGAAMTVLGIGLTVAIVVTMMALVSGLDATFIETGEENQLIVIRKGSQNEVSSYFDRDLFQTVRFLPGVARTEEGEPMAAGELLVVINHRRITGEFSNINLRGVSERSRSLRPQLTITEGRFFRPGVREIVVSRSLSRRFENLALGSRIRIARSDWTVVGIFEAGGTAYDAEIWAAYSEVALDWDRPFYSSILLRARDIRAASGIQRRIAADKRIQLQAIDEKEYFRGQTIASIGIKALGAFVAVVMGVGSCFAAMNMMYGAVMSRAPEIGTLRVLGFRRRSILASFMVESTVLGVAGGVVGCLMALPVHGISTGTVNLSAFSEILFNFRITPQILLWGMTYAAGVGLLGGFFPARRAARIVLLEALRQQ
jgi:putative ABC transport system permease protein